MSSEERVRAGGDQGGGEPARGAWRRAAFFWVDPESGQRLRVELRGPRELLSGLEAHGFEPLADDPAIDVDGVAAGRAELER